MAEVASSVDQPSTPTPPEYSGRSSNPESAAKPPDKIEQALNRLFTHAEAVEKQHRDSEAATDAKAKELKALGIAPGQSVSLGKLPLNRTLIERAISALNPGRLKVKEFQERMGFFDTSALARVRKSLTAAGVTVESAEGSVVFVKLTDEFTSKEA